MQALLLRCRYVTKHNARAASKPLYALVNFQLLRTSVQMAVVVLLEQEFIGQLIPDAANLLREYSLVFIGGEGNAKDK